MSVNPKFFPESKPLSREAQILMRAANLIRERGHTKCVLQDRHGQLCTVGAVNLASNGDAARYSPKIWDRWFDGEGAHRADAMKMLGRHVGKLYPEWHGYQVSQWNDDVTRTPGEVIAALEGAALGV